MGVMEPLRRGVVMDPERVRALIAQPSRRVRLFLPVAVSLAPLRVLAMELRGPLLGLGWAAHSMTDVQLVGKGFDLGLLPWLRCPWGRGGDLLFAREPWAQVARGFRYSPHARIGEESPGVFLSPESMPERAARLWLRIDTVTISEDVEGAPVWALALDIVPGPAGVLR